MPTHKLTEAQRRQIADKYATRNPDGTFPLQIELAEEFGVSESTVWRIVGSAGISGVSRKGSNNRKLLPSDIDDIVRLYTTPLPDGTWRGMDEIADMYSVTKPCVYYHLKRANIILRASGEAQSGKDRGGANRPRNEQPPLCKCGCGQRVEWSYAKRGWKKYAKGHYRPQRPYHDRDWLYTEYVTNERSAPDIASQFSIQTGVVYKFLRKFGIDTRTTGDSLRASGAVRGENNPAWKGGVADWDYSYDWKTIANGVRDRDKWTCQLCGEQRQRWNGDLHVHHIDEDKLNNHPHNLISLCPSCHHRLHGDLSIRPKLVCIAQRNSS